MSTQSLHLVDQEVEEEELSIMEIRSRNDSPFQRPTSVLQTFMTGISNQLAAMSQQQNAMSQQQSAMSQQQCHLTERLDRVEESLHGSGKRSSNSDFWTSRPAVTTHQVVVPEPQSSLSHQFLLFGEVLLQKGYVLRPHLSGEL